MVAAEDTRRTKHLLDHFQIGTKLMSYHAFNEHRKTSEIIGMVREGRSVAMVSDAGTPGIADPGFLLAREARKEGIEPIVIPGVSSLTFTVTAAGLPCEKFAFYGFLPVKSGRRLAALRAIAAEDKSVLLFESPHRIAKLLNEIVSEIGPGVPLAIIREATKIHEEVLRGTAAELRESCEGRNWKGEIVVMLSSQTEEIIENQDELQRSR